MTQIKPLQVKNHLAAHNNQQPQFAIEAQLKNGKKIAVSDPRAIRSMIALMDMNAVLGGAASHYGGPAALADLWSALHALVFHEASEAQQNWFNLFHLINDAGHCENGLYAIKANYKMAGVDLQQLRKFRSIDSFLTGHGEAHLFPQGVYMSNGPLGSAFPQSQGLAIAEKLAGTGRLTVCTLSDGAAMEGEAKEAMAAIPGLAAKGLLAPYVVIISDNNTKLSGRIDKDAFSMAATFRAFETLGWKVMQLEQAHDLQKCVTTLEEAFGCARQNPQQPVAIWAKTIKGIGTKKTAEASTGAHGFPCKSATELTEFVGEIYGGSAVPQEFQSWIQELINLENKIKANAVPDSGEKIQKGIAKAMIQSLKKGYPVVSVTSDLPGSTGVADFRKEFPQASIDVGVAESNMISTAAGLSKQGFIPVVDTFAQFGVTKGALPLTMAMLSEAPMIAVFSHTGFQDAADGASHQALSYMSMLATIPHVKLYNLSCSEEAEVLMTQAIELFAQKREAGETPDSAVFFLGRENFPKNFGVQNFSMTEPQVVQSHVIGTKNVMLVTSGSLVGETLKAAQKLKDKHVGSFVVNISCLNSFEVKNLIPLLKQAEGRIVTVEDHQVLLGLGSILSHKLMQSGQFAVMKSLGVHGEFGQSAYNAIELYRKHSMDSDSIVKAALEIMG